MSQEEQLPEGPSQAEKEVKQLEEKITYKLIDTVWALRRMSKHRRRETRGFSHLPSLRFTSEMSDGEKQACLQQNLDIYDRILTGPHLRSEQIYPRIGEAYTDTYETKNAEDDLSGTIRTTYTPIDEDEVLLSEKTFLDEQGVPYKFEVYLLYSPLATQLIEASPFRQNN